MKKKSIKDIFPIVLIENAVALNSSGDISIYFKLDLKEIFSISPTEYEFFQRILSTAISGLPDNTYVQKLDFFIEEVYKPDLLKSYVLQANEKFYAERPFLNHTSYLILSFCDNSKKGPLESNLYRHSAKLDVIDSVVLKAIKNAEVFQEIVNGSGGIKLNKLNDDDIIELLYRYSNLDFTGSVNSSSNEFTVNKNNLVIGNKIVNVIKIREFSNIVTSSLPIKSGSVEVSLIHPIALGFQKNHIISTVIRKNNTKKEISKLTNVVNQCNWLQTAENKSLQENLTGFIKDATDEREDIVSLDCNIILFGLSEKEVNSILNEFRSSCAKIDLRPLVLSDTSFLSWFSNIPGNASDIYDFRTMLLSVAVMFLNIETNYKNGIKGIKFNDYLTGVPVVVDLRSEMLDARNVVTVGPTGSGKSFTQNYITHQLYWQKEHIVIVDVGDSYKRNCLSVGGKYFKYSLDNPIEFNPFTISDFDFKKGKDDIDNNNIIFLRTLFFRIWGEEKQTRESETVLADVITGYYNICHDRKEIPDFKGFYDYIDLYFDQFSKDIDYFNAHSFKRVLKPFYDGRYAKLLNGKGNLNLVSERFIVFELKEIKDNHEILPIVSLIIIETIMEKFRRLKGINKVIIIEEAWSMLSGHNMTKFLDYMWRTCRKHNGASNLVTQSASEIEESPIRNAIVSNTFTYFVLDHSKNQEQIPILQRTLGFTDNDVRVLNTMQNTQNYKCVLVRINGVSKIYRVEVSDTAKAAFTSTESEILEIEKTNEKFGGNIEFMINNFVQQKQLDAKS